MSFFVRGRHSVMWPTALPPWTPESVVDKMLYRFKNHLRLNLTYMILHAGKGIARRSSRASAMSDGDSTVDGRETQPELVNEPLNLGNERSGQERIL